MPFKDNGKIKLMIIVGTRPEIIRLAAVINKCREYFDTLLVHTGQNYDYTLNGVFFKDLGIKDPDIYLDAVGKDLGEEFQVTSMSFSEMQKTSGEITIRGVDKALGIKKVIEFLGASWEDTVAFGDGPNDYEMLEYVHTGVAMGNASDDLKALASLVTTPINQDGIYNGMKRLELIQNYPIKSWLCTICTNEGYMVK